MSSIFTAQNELLLPLIEGIHESPPWGDFLKHLVARTYARRAFLLITLANSSIDQLPTIVHAVAPRAATDAPLNFSRFEKIGLVPYGTLRPGRVYSLDELLDYSRQERVAQQRAELDEMGANYGRFLRVSAGDAADAWLLLVREREDFTAAAVATLSSIAPPLAAALKTLVALIDQRLKAALAESSLHKLGIGQFAFDEKGRVLEADSLAEELVPYIQEPEHFRRRRLQVTPGVQQALEKICTDFSSGAASGSFPILLDADKDIWLLLQKATLPLTNPTVTPAAVGSLRVYRRESSAVARRTMAAMYGLSINEAALAHEMSLGKSIVEAGRSLQLTTETSRNYSKRIYAKTRTGSQADLVRLILTGVSSLG